MSIYCVYFTTYSGQLMPPFYIGSTSVAKIEKGYRGSVIARKWKIIWKQELKNNPQLFHTEIVSLHETRKEAYDAELLYQKEEQVVPNAMFINARYADLGLVICTGPFSESHKQKLSQAKKGKTWEEIYGVEQAKEMRINASIKASRACTDGTKQKISRSNSGQKRPPRDEKTKKRLSEFNKGKKLSEEHKQKLRIAKQKKKTCTFCLKEGSGASMNRWHFSRCRSKKTTIDIS